MFTIKKYLNFNRDGKAEISAFTLSNELSVGTCKYVGNDRSIFLIEEPTLTYVAKGNKYMIVNNKEFFLAEGDALYIPKNSIAFTNIPDQLPVFESINIKLSGVLEGQIPLTLTPVLWSKDQTVRRKFLQLKKVLMEEPATILAANIIAELLWYFNCSLPAENAMQQIKNEDLGKMKAVLLETVFEPTTISLIAKKCNMSTSTFKRKFELTFGIPPKLWKRSVCLQTAYFNLRTGNYKVSDIVANIGYDNFSHFSYAFKKQFHSSPSQIAGNKLN